MSVFYFVLALPLYLMSLLPFWMLYGISDVLSFITFRVVGYRKKVVYANLHAAFPKKSIQEIEEIAKQFYKNLTDVLVETIKQYSLSEKQFAKRVVFTNPSVLTQLYEQQKSVIAVTGHIGSWEWVGLIGFKQNSSYIPMAAAKPLSNKFVDYLVFKNRRRFGTVVVHTKYIIKELLKRHQQGQKTLTFLIADQSPTKQEIEYWMPFLYQDTPVFLGAEKLAKALDQAVVFVDTYRVKRGYYKVDLTLITDSPKTTVPYEITTAHVRCLEQAIRLRPANWLWSHRRWKHKRERIDA